MYACAPNCVQIRTSTAYAVDLRTIGALLGAKALSWGPTVARTQAPPDFSELGPSYDGADPVYPD